MGADPGDDVAQVEERVDVESFAGGDEAGEHRSGLASTYSPGGVCGVWGLEAVVDEIDVEGKWVIALAKPAGFGEFPDNQYITIFSYRFQ